MHLTIIQLDQLLRAPQVTVTTVLLQCAAPHAEKGSCFYCPAYAYCVVCIPCCTVSVSHFSRPPCLMYFILCPDISLY